MTNSFPFRTRNPLTLLEDVALDSGWAWGRLNESETIVVVDDFPCPLYFISKWTKGSSPLSLKGFFNIPIPVAEKQAAESILRALNDALGEGRFVYCKKRSHPIFEQKLYERTRGVLMLNRIETMFQNALDAGERLFEAMDLVLANGKSPGEAIFNAITPVVGEA